MFFFSFIMKIINNQLDKKKWKEKGKKSRFLRYERPWDLMFCTIIMQQQDSLVPRRKHRQLTMLPSSQLAWIDEIFVYALNHMYGLILDLLTNRCCLEK